MPELPEVETVARGLQREIAGRRILTVTLGKTDFIDNPAEIELNLPSRTIERIERYGKFMLLRLAHPTVQEPSALLVHLGMTGSLMPRPVAQPHAKHTHVVFLLDDGRELRYVDPRRFGRMAFLAGPRLQAELLRFGVDPLEATRGGFVDLIRGRHSRIKALLLDQSVLRGVGNIYADESLWRAKIHPARTGASLTPADATLLYTELQKILRRAIELRGSSISDFRDSDGLPGDYQQHHRVYGREGKPCFRCKTPVRRIIVAGRSSHFCPKCQKAPRKPKRRSKSRQIRRPISRKRRK